MTVLLYLLSLPSVEYSHKASQVSRLLCVTMSKTFTVLEQMPCSHTTTPLAMIPAELIKLYVPKITPLVKDLLTDHLLHQEGLHYISLCPHTWFCTVCSLVNEKVSHSSFQLLFLPALFSIQDPHRSLQGQRLPEKLASQWSSREHDMTGQFMTI